MKALKASRGLGKRTYLYCSAVGCRYRARASQESAQGFFSSPCIGRAILLSGSASCLLFCPSMGILWWHFGMQSSRYSAIGDHIGHRADIFRSGVITQRLR
jgi:hypothetical protein